MVTSMALTPPGRDGLGAEEQLVRGAGAHNIHHAGIQYLVGGRYPWTFFVSRWLVLIF